MKGTYRLGVYEPLDNRRPVLFGPTFTNSLRDRQRMRRVIELFNQRVESDLESVACVGVFPARERKVTL